MKTYGKATLKKGKWVIEAEPHVVLRLKRVFASLGRRDRGKLRLSDTIDNCRELAWFCERYPLEITPRDYLEQRAAEHRERESVVAELLAGTVTAREFQLALPPREYQRMAAELALRSRGLLVGDEVGLGKTATAICVMTDPSTRPALVVAPAHLQRQWQDEIRRFAPALETHILKRSEPYDYTAIKTRRRKGCESQLALVKPHPDVLICTYAKLAGWADTLKGVVKSVFYDEAHELRRGTESQKGQAAMLLAAHVSCRVGLSATPIFNYGGEFWNVMEALRPGALGEYSEFTEAWCTGGGDKPKLKEPKAFGSYVRDAGLMLRRTRAEVGRELPPLLKAPHHIDADEGALDAIASPAAELARIILEKSAGQEKGTQFRASGELDAMVRQATGLAKAVHVAAFVRMLVENGEKVVLAGWHHRVYDIWRERLADYSPAIYTGRESPNQKDEAKRRFCAGETPVLILSLRSGAGIDGLQYSGCRTVVFGELDWSPAVHEQFAGRVHRDGQEQSVIAYYLIANTGADPIIADVLGVKRAQLEGLLDPKGAGLERLDTGGANIRRLAEEYLKKQKGHAA